MMHKTEHHAKVVAHHVVSDLSVANAVNVVLKSLRLLA
jgi:hypothetical protein